MAYFGKTGKSTYVVFLERTGLLVTLHPQPFSQREEGSKFYLRLGEANSPQNKTKELSSAGYGRSEVARTE